MYVIYLEYSQIPSHICIVVFCARLKPRFRIGDTQRGLGT